MANNKKSNKIIEWLGTGWGVFVSALSIFGMGFASGLYVANKYSDLENYKKEAIYYHELLDCKQELFDYKVEKEKEIFELRSTINKLQSEIEKQPNKHGDEK